MLENIPGCLKSFADKEPGLICELQQRQHYKLKGQPPYFSKIIRFALFALYFFLGVQNVVIIFSISFVIFFGKT